MASMATTRRQNDPIEVPWQSDGWKSSTFDHNLVPTTQKTSVIVVTNNPTDEIQSSYHKENLGRNLTVEVDEPVEDCSKERPDGGEQEEAAGLGVLAYSLAETIDMI